MYIIYILYECIIRTLIYIILYAQNKDEKNVKVLNQQAGESLFFSSSLWLLTKQIKV